MPASGGASAGPLPPRASAMLLSQAIADLGVRPDTLTDDEKARLDEDGYLQLDGILEPDQLQTITHTFLQLLEVRHTFKDTYDDPLKNGNKLTLANLQNKDPCFDVCFSHPRVVAAVTHVLAHEGPDVEGFRSNGVHGRLNPPGWGGNVVGTRQNLHTDGAAPDGNAPTFPTFYTCNSIWFLSEFNENNGGTHVVPGSHRFGERPGPDATPHSRERRLTGPAGTVVVFNSHVWHSAGHNTSTGNRPALTSFWGRGERDDAAHLLPEPEGGKAWGELNMAAFQRLSPAMRRLFDRTTEDAEGPRL